MIGLRSTPQLSPNGTKTRTNGHRVLAAKISNSNSPCSTHISERRSHLFRISPDSTQLRSVHRIGTECLSLWLIINVLGLSNPSSCATYLLTDLNDSDGHPSIAQRPSQSSHPATTATHDSSVQHGRTMLALSAPVLGSLFSRRCSWRRM